MDECVNCGCDPKNKIIVGNHKTYKYGCLNPKGDLVTVEATHKGKFLRIRGKNVPIDLKLYNVIKALNSVGLKTLFSCEDSDGGLAQIIFDAKDIVVQMDNYKEKSGMFGQYNTKSTMTLAWKYERVKA